MHRFGTEAPYRVIDRVRRCPEKEVGDRVFVISKQVKPSSSSAATSPLCSPRTRHNSSSSCATAQEGAQEEGHTPPTIVAQWSRDKALAAELLPVPTLPTRQHGARGETERVVILTTPLEY